MATVESPFDTDYELRAIGQSTGLPTPYAGLIFKKTDFNTLLVGGAGNQAGSALYEVPVIRDGSNKIIGVGPATLVINAPYIDGGVAYSNTKDVLFVTGYPTNILHQFKDGSTEPDDTTTLTGLGVVANTSVGSVGVSPLTFPGAGNLVLIVWPSGNTYYTTITFNGGTGLYALGSIVAGPTIPGGPEGFVYVPTGSAQFTAPSMLVTEYSSGRVTAYEIDGNGLPILASSRPMITGLLNAEGAAIDPLTGSYVFTTFGADDNFYVLDGGFVPPDQAGVLACRSTLTATGSFVLAPFLYRLEYVKDSSVAMDEGLFIQTNLELPEYKSVSKELYEGDSEFLDRFFGIDGVVAVEAASHRLYIEKSPVFNWDEVLPDVIDELVDALGVTQISRHSGLSIRLDSLENRREKL